MKTVILSKNKLSEAVVCLKKGLPVIFPTETVYGLGASIFDQEGIQKIFSLKKRPPDNPLIAHIAAFEDIQKIALNLDSRFHLLAEKFWPGPLALVVPKNPYVPSLATGGKDSIAVRMPANKIALELIKGVKQPLVAPSANISGKPSPTKLEHALEDFEGTVDCAIDGGECEIGIESTVLSLLGKEPVLLRPGRITKEALQSALGCKIASPQPEDHSLSPGMKYRHYAPRAKLDLIFDQKKLGPFFIEPSQELFYQQLREVDRKNLKIVQVYVSASVQNDDALMNRLLRAAGQIV